MENTRTIKTAELAFSYAGFYLGAGYLSGQELWQFFGVYGNHGVYGMIFAVSSLALLGMLLFAVARTAGTEEFDRAIIRFYSPAALRTFALLEMFFTFAVFMIMSAGGGALFEQVLGLPHAIGSALFCIAVALVSLSGLNGLLKAMSLLVPVLTVTTLVIAVLAIIRNGGAPVCLTPEPVTNPLTGNWLFSALTYISYNFFGAVCVCVPMAKHISSRTAKLGPAIGSVILGIVAAAIFTPMAMNPEATEAQLPILAIAQSIDPRLGYVSAVPLLFGMFGTSLSAIVAVLAYGESRIPSLHSRRAPITAVLALITWLGSLFGFDKLISILYPICGYVGIIVIVLLIERRIYQLRHKETPHHE
ncbi:MAG: hypothetical protein IJC24_01340 [Clostridia bacterium]|nr:hypothetical protein [Clostridia bacterium]